MANLQEKNADKLRDDRDTALALCATFNERLRILAEHVCIFNGRLAFTNPNLTKEEAKALSVCLEEYK